MIESNDWPGASKLLQKATELARRSSYVANMRAIATMKVEGAQNAQHYFEQLREFEEKSGSKDFWSLGNQVNAALGLGNTAKADALLEKLSRIPEAYDNRESVARYFDEIINLRKKHDDGFEYNWKAKWK